MSNGTGIVEAALNVFCERGYQRASLPEIIKRAGMRENTPFNYYSSKKDLLISAMQLARQRNHSVYVCIPSFSRGRALSKYVELMFEALAGIRKTSLFMLSVLLDPIVGHDMIPAFSENRDDYIIDFFTPYLPGLSSGKSKDLIAILNSIINEFYLNSDAETACNATLRVLRFAGAAEYAYDVSDVEHASMH